MSPHGSTDQDETWHAGRPRPWPHCVRWGPSSPSSKGRIIETFVLQLTCPDFPCRMSRGRKNPIWQYFRKAVTTARLNALNVTKSCRSAVTSHDIAGVLQASTEDRTVCPKLSWSRQLCLWLHLTVTLFHILRCTHVLSLFLCCKVSLQSFWHYAT